MRERETWTVRSDAEAEWVIDACNSDLVEIDRYIQSLEDRLAAVRDKLAQAKAERQRKIDWRNGHLMAYFEAIDPKLKRKTKTQEKYRLPSGSIVKKYPAPEFIRTDDQLLTWIKASGKTDLIETRESLKWGEIKKEITVAGNRAVYLATGEIVEGIEVIERPPVLEFKEG